MTRTPSTVRHRPQLSTTVDPDLAQDLTDLSAATEIPQARLLDRAVRLLVDLPENRRLIGARRLAKRGDRAPAPRGGVAR